MLSQVSSVHLTDFTACVLWHSNSVEWSQVDEALQRSTFSTLEKVEICCFGELLSFLRTSLPERIVHLMPKCAARGILDVRRADRGSRDVRQAYQESLANLSLVVE
jgi:hypothetical protein